MEDIGLTIFGLACHSYFTSSLTVPSSGQNPCNFLDITHIIDPDSPNMLKFTSSSMPYYCFELRNNSSLCWRSYYRDGVAELWSRHDANIHPAARLRFVFMEERFHRSLDFHAADYLKCGRNSGEKRKHGNTRPVDSHLSAVCVMLAK